MRAVTKAAASGSLSLGKASVPKLLFGFRGSAQNPHRHPSRGCCECVLQGEGFSFVRCGGYSVSCQRPVGRKRSSLILIPDSRSLAVLEDDQPACCVQCNRKRAHSLAACGKSLGIGL